MTLERVAPTINSRVSPPAFLHLIGGSGATKHEVFREIRARGSLGEVSVASGRKLQEKGMRSYESVDSYETMWNHIVL